VAITDWGRTAPTPLRSRTFTNSHPKKTETPKGEITEASQGEPDIERIQALAYISRSALCGHSNETRTPIANPPNTAQLEGTPYHSPKLHPGPCSSVGIRRRTDRHTDTQTRVTNIHFVSSTTPAKCNKRRMGKTGGQPGLSELRTTSQNATKITASMVDVKGRSHGECCGAETRGRA